MGVNKATTLSLCRYSSKKKEIDQCEWAHVNNLLALGPQSSNDHFNPELSLKAVAHLPVSPPSVT